MIKLRPSEDDHDLANAVAEFLFDHGQAAMQNVKKYDSSADRFYREVVDSLGSHYNQLSSLLNLTMNAQASMLAHEILAKLMLAAWNLGNAAVVSPEVQQKLKEWQTAKMREVRAAAPEEEALRTAIEAELAGRTVLRPKKEAYSILGGVNARLKAGGYAEVLVDVVYRRLKKPRVLEERP